MFGSAHQFAFKFGDQFPHGLANRTPPVVENGIPIGERILVHWTTLPAPNASNG